MARAAFASLALAGALLGSSRPAFADGTGPSQKKARTRTCCALATHLPLHLGSAHVPVALGIVVSPQSLGPHSYLGDGASSETNGLIYTRRGGFVDTGHTREFADLTAHLVAELRPLLARGEGMIRLDPRDADIRVRLKAPVPEAAVARTSNRLAERIAFQVSVWVEISQHYGHTVVRGAEEFFSSFTPEDLYSNLLGAHLGAAAFDSALPYDRAMDTLLADVLRSLGATSAAETRRILGALADRWWRADTPWPSAHLPIAHSFDIGPHMMPVLAPADIAPPPTASPAVLELPELDERGAPLADLYDLEIVPNLRSLPHFTDAGAFSVVTGENLPALVDLVRASIAAGEDAPPSVPPRDENDSSGALAHYLVGLHLVELKVTGGLGGAPSRRGAGIAGGSLMGIRGDTRAGDFGVVRFDLGHTPERGLIAGFSLYRSDALFFCHDRETGQLRAPLLSLLGPCTGGEWLGIGGSIGEAVHDGDTGRTALRPISAYGVLDVLGNGQSPSYDRLRLLLRAGGAVEHVWTEAEGGATIPRVGANTLMLVRTPGRSFELHGGAGYRLDPSTPRDAALESNVGLRWYFLLGANRSAVRVDGVDPWAVGSLGVDGGYSFWTRPAHAFADVALPFVSGERSATWQVLVTTTLGFQGLTF